MYNSAGKEKVAKEERQIERYRARDISTGGERQEQRERVITNSRETLIQKERDRNKGKELELTRDLLTEGERLEQS